MKPRAVILAAVAVMVLSGATAAAVALPGQCPAGYRYAIDPSCISETARIASDGSTTRDFTNALDQRWGLRLEIAGFGLVAAGALLLLSARDLRKRDDLLQLDEEFAPTAI